ncbi:MAG: hypothetical protein ABI156_15840 [Caldimonas sp.]
MNCAISKWLVAGLVASTGVSWAQGTVPPSRDRQHIEADRAAAEARFVEREHACGERFIVTSCVDDAKRERREALSRLRHEQNQLDDALRKARAAERTEAIRKHAAEQAERAGESASREPRVSVRRSPAEPHVGKPEAGAEKSLPSAQRPHAAGSAARAGVSRADEEARSRARFNAAHREAEAHRLEVEQRNARRAAKHKPAVPLPLPPGASAP